MRGTKREGRDWGIGSLINEGPLFESQLAVSVVAGIEGELFGPSAGKDSDWPW